MLSTDFASHIQRLIYAVNSTLLDFVRLFRKAHAENCKKEEAEKKKAQKEIEMEKGVK